jgi:cytochrome c oxidase accessory protein FixG
MTDMQTAQAPPMAAERVLSTLEADGRRRWLRPRRAAGRFERRRRVVAWLLIALFTVTPFVRIDGTPLFQFDVAHRRFTFFATTFNADETLLLALLVVSIFLGIFLITALAGRAWCGWACPQTVYMEFLYRPIERLVEGRHYTSGGRVPLAPWRRVLKYAIFTVVSFHLANTFLAWFVGVDTMFEWTTRSPFEHPGPFALVAFVTLLMMADFCFFREQMCTLACPYGRLQSVLLDRQSLIVGYDTRRGEPRGRRKHGVERTGQGDCVDCGLCVQVCPTGIDIRDGLQLECVACTQCIDACDGVMDKLGRPRGLIRYTSQSALAGESRRLLRPRVVLYPLALAGFGIAFIVALASRGTAELELLRVRATPYEVLEDGQVSSRTKLKITNRSDVERTYSLEIEAAGARVIAPALPARIGPSDSLEADLFVLQPLENFEQGKAAVLFRVVDDQGEVLERTEEVLGPLFAPAGGGR